MNYEKVVDHDHVEQVATMTTMANHHKNQVPYTNEDRSFTSTRRGDNPNLQSIRFLRVTVTEPSLRVNNSVIFICKVNHRVNLQVRFSQHR